MSSETLRAALGLHLAGGVGAVLYSRLIEKFGSPIDALAAGPAGWRSVQGIGSKTAEAIRAVSEADIDEELALADRAGAEIVTVGSDRYPAALETIFDPPVVLYVRGRLTRPDAVALGVVGARRCTHYGMEQAERFGGLLGRAGLTVVSGGARGIDTAAHRGALTAGGRTIAVMGCGLCETYPPENAKLFDRIVSEDRGAVISELPMLTSVLSGNFPTRNRIISGLSLGVLIVEAARRSGSLITAREADEQGRRVFAIPGRVDSPMSGGTNRLIRDGVTLVQNLDDILDELGDVGAVLTRADEQERAAEDDEPPGLSDLEATLHASLSDGPLGLDELLRRTGIESGRAVSAMTMLVLKGAVEQRPGNIFARKRR